MMESPTRDHVSDGQTGCTPGVEDSPQPPITERLAQLCSSRELLEFYRGKVAQFDGVHEDLLEKYICTTEDQVNMMDSPPRDHVSDGQTGCTPGVEDSPQPPITECLAQLCASRELLEFYRGKVAQFDGVHEDLLEKYRCTTEDQKLQWEVEVSELQEALREKEQALCLYSENNVLQIREREDSKRIQHLLALVGPDIGGITYFHSDPPYKVTIAQKELEPRILDHRETTKSGTGCEKGEGNQKSRSEEGVVNGGSPEQYRRDNQTLVLQVEALPVQMEEQTGLSKEKVESLLEDRRIHVEEGQVQHQRDQDPITALTDKLEGTQNLTDESSRDFLQLKFETRAGEMVEKDRLLRELNTNQDRLREARDSHGMEQPGSRGPSSVALHLQREELQDRSDKMAKRLQMMTQRYEALKKRAAMEVEGFKTDNKHLKRKLKDVEKQLFKVRQTNIRIRKVQGELKVKIYGLENDLRYS